MLFSSSNTGRTDLRDTEVQQPNVAATLSTEGPSGRLPGSGSWCADRHSRCRPAPSASPCFHSKGNQPPGLPAGLARRRYRKRYGCIPGLHTAPDRTGCCSVPRTPAGRTCATPRSSSRTWRRPCRRKGLQVGFQDLVRGARIDIVGAGQHPALHLVFIPKVINRRDCLLVWRGAGIENVTAAFLAFILHRIEQDAVQFLEHRQDGLARNRGPAAERGGDLVDGNELPRLFSEQRPVGGGID